MRISIKLLVTPLRIGAHVLLFSVCGLPFGAYCDLESAAGTEVAVKVGSQPRDPFWPIDYKPPVEGEVVQVVVEQVEEQSKDWTDAKKLVRINGVSKSADGRIVAVINNRVVRVGERVSVLHGSLKYTWRVASVKESGSVELHRVSVQ